MDATRQYSRFKSGRNYFATLIGMSFAPRRLPHTI
jgi:hypothetical protein